jgi:hypothetical protein
MITDRLIAKVVDQMMTPPVDDTSRATLFMARTSSG